MADSLPPASGVGSAYSLDQEALRAANGNIAGTLTQGLNVVRDLAALIVPPTSFAQIGSGVAAANTTMQAHQVSGVQALLRLLQDVSGLVERARAGYDSADQATAAGYGGTGSGSGTAGSPVTGTSASGGLWASPLAGRVAAAAASDSPPVAGDPHSVDSVVGYLQQAHAAGVGAAAPAVPHPADGATQPVAFADWLDQSPTHQQALGVVGVYSGQVRTLADIPGGLHGGDVVVVQPPAAGSAVAVAGPTGALYNHGLVTPDFSGGATVRVYRPISV